MSFLPITGVIMLLIVIAAVIPFESYLPLDGRRYNDC